MTGSSSKVIIEEFTSPCPITVNRKESLYRLKELMQSEGVRHIPVVENSLPVGIVSDRDLKLVAHLRDNVDQVHAEDIMAIDPYTVSSEDLLEDVALEMSKRKIGSAIVLDRENQVCGIFTVTDALNALVEVLRGDV